MDNTVYSNQVMPRVGIPYDNIVWQDIPGQPFGIASQFNAIVFHDANNIVDTKGAMAVGGNFSSPRGLTLGFGRDTSHVETGYTPDYVRFLAGGNVSVGGPLVVAGHVVGGGRFRVASGSTYFIGKDGSPMQIQELSSLYRTPGGSRYWVPSDKGDHYLISSYDVPRYIPAGRVEANVQQFFQNARLSIENYKECIEALETNGTVIDHFHEWILRGNDPELNVFLIDARPNGILNKGIRAEVPAGSIVIVKMRTGNRAHLQYGLWGDQAHASRTLYVFEDALEIFMEVPAAIWGSILAPQAMFHAHATGGHVTGNAALGSFAVSPTSGFEFHLPPFEGGVFCEQILPAPFEEVPFEEAPLPLPEVTPIMECPECPLPMPCPMCPEQEECPLPMPCPMCPEQEECPLPMPCPMCPEQEECPECPECPEQKTVMSFVPFPVPVPYPTCPETICCPECPECPITPGVIFGCIWGCSCCKSHEWEVRLYQYCNDVKVMLYCETVCYCGCFEFEVPYEGYYLLEVCPSRYYRKARMCKPTISLKNIGVTNLIIE